jgi:DmsE family decaheme c-type cytochrome
MRTIDRPTLPIVVAASTYVLISLGLATLGARELRAGTPARLTGTCLECHDDRGKSLVGTPHQVATDAADSLRARVACTDCHKPDPRHWESDPQTYPMGNPAKASADEAAAICSRCHESSHQQSMTTGNPHAVNGVGCLGCHQVHGPGRTALLQRPEPDLCLGCHGAVRGQFAKPSRHPVADAVMTCSDCHLKQADTRPTLTWSGTNSACFGCHDEFRGPFPYEHPATMDFSTEEGGCLNCHDPHGSNLPRLLKQPYEAPNFGLCTQCHFVPKHGFNQEHQDRFAGVACSECHVDIHGSYDNRLFLSPALRAQGCSAVGCHHF